MIRFCIYFCIGFFLCGGAYANQDIAENIASYIPRACDTDSPPPSTVHDEPSPEQSTTMPLITINADTNTDMNMAASLDMAEPSMRPTAVSVPGISNYTIDNLEIKLRVLKLQF